MTISSNTCELSRLAASITSSMLAFGANVRANVEILAVGGSIGLYSTDVDTPAIPFWPLLFKNTRIYYVGRVFRLQRDFARTHSSVPDFFSAVMTVRMMRRRPRRSL